MVKNLPAIQETGVRSLGQEDPLEKEMAPHSSTLAWKIPWTEEPGRLQSTGSQRVRHNWATSLSLSFLFRNVKMRQSVLSYVCGNVNTVPFYRFFSQIGYYRIFMEFPVLYIGSLIIICFIYNSVLYVHPNLLIYLCVHLKNIFSQTFFQEHLS